MRKIVWTTLGAALIVVGITAAWTQTRTWRGGHGPICFNHGPMGYIAHELDLSDKQKSQIKTIWESERPNISELVREFASEQKEMDALTFQEGAPDEGRIQDHHTPGCDAGKAVCGEGKAHGQDLLPGSESCTTHQSG